MTRDGRAFTRILLATALLWAGGIWAGEGKIARVRGSSLGIDRGTEDGLVVGMEVKVVRSQEEAIIHPITGENLGSPAIELGVGEVTAASEKAATIRLRAKPLLSVAVGDKGRFTTADEVMLQEQERAAANRETAADERRKLRRDVGQLTQNIKSIQGTIRGLEGVMKRLGRVEDAIKLQLRSVNRDVTTLQDELRQLKETIVLMGEVPVESGQGEVTELSEENAARLRELIKDELQNQLSALPPAVAAAPGAVAAAAPPVVAATEGEPPPLTGLLEDVELENPSAAQPFYTRIWFLGLLAFVGLAGVGYYLYTRMAAGDGADEEIEEDEDLDELGEEEEFEIEEEEEEDDIVVEETA